MGKTEFEPAPLSVKFGQKGWSVGAVDLGRDGFQMVGLQAGEVVIKKITMFVQDHVIRIAIQLLE